VWSRGVQFLLTISFTQKRQNTPITVGETEAMELIEQVIGDAVESKLASLIQQQDEVKKERDMDDIGGIDVLHTYVWLIGL
jgi:hypothetical protein